MTPAGGASPARPPAASGRCFVAWAQAGAPEALGPRGAVAGTTRRGSHGRPHRRAPLHLVSAWAAASGLGLGPVAVGDKSHEIAAIPAVLRVLALGDRPVTIDALGRQTAIAAQSVAQGGADVRAVKDSQPTVQEEVRRTFAHARADDYARTVDRDHGRLELRRHRALHDPELRAHRDPEGRWARRRGIGLVEAERQVGETATVAQRYHLLRGRCAATGAASIGCIGGWMARPTRRPAACERATARGTWRCCGTARATGCARSAAAGAASPPHASPRPWPRRTGHGGSPAWPIFSPLARNTRRSP